MPNSVRFDAIYKPGKVEAVSYRNGQEISRDVLETSGKPAKIRLAPNKYEMKADGHDLIYVEIDILDEDDHLVTDAAVELTASVEGCGLLAGFGTGNPVTDEVYTDHKTVTFRGNATAIVRSGYGQGNITVRCFCPGEKTLDRELNLKCIKA